MIWCAAQFESSVNSEGIETGVAMPCLLPGFESSVNSEGIETGFQPYFTCIMFESSVNSEGIETLFPFPTMIIGLRAV